MLFPVLGDHPPDFVQAQRLDAAETLLREAQETSRLTSQRVYDAELHRVWGELHSARGDPAAAERDLLQAISLAARQGGSGTGVGRRRPWRGCSLNTGGPLMRATCCTPRLPPFQQTRAVRKSLPHGRSWPPACR